MNTSATRRDFMTRVAALAAVGSGAGLASGRADACAQGPAREEGAEDAQGAAAGLGGAVQPGADAVTEATFAEAEKLAGIRFTPTERAQMLRTIAEQRALLAARLAGPVLPNDLAPAEVFRAALPGGTLVRATPQGDPSTLPLLKLGAAPPKDVELAFASLPLLAAWLRAGVVTSRRMTELALARLEHLNDRLFLAITIPREAALARADAMDRELRAGRVRGPLHGVPYGAKDILDTAGIATTWGAEPFQGRVPERNAWVVDALDRAGAVLVAKTAVGALAYGDIWFGGRCRNPWDPSEGSSGSSAGSASAVAAGAVPFAIGTETLGSIVSPCVRCGASGLRPTFGRVPRTGCMSLVWSMDKIGPIARTLSDCGVVLGAINGQDNGDASSVAETFTWSMDQSAKGLRVGVVREWLQGDEGEACRDAVEAVRAAGADVVEVPAPSVPAAMALLVPLMSEAAAAFENLTRSGQDDELAWQEDAAWPNSFRQAWFIPAVEAVQAGRVRRRAMQVMHDFFSTVDCLLCPPFAGDVLLATNACGQPCAVARCGFDAKGAPRSVAVVGRLFDEGTPLRVGAAIEAALAADGRRPTVAVW